MLASPCAHGSGAGGSPSVGFEGPHAALVASEGPQQDVGALGEGGSPPPEPSRCRVLAAGPFPGARGRGGAARLAACPLNHARASHRRLRRRGVVYCNSWRRARQRTPNEFKLPKEVTAETNSSQGRKGFVRGARSCRRDRGAPPGCSALEFALPSAAFPDLQNHPELRAFNPAKKLKPRFFFPQRSGCPPTEPFLIPALVLPSPHRPRLAAASPRGGSPRGRCLWVRGERSTAFFLAPGAR